ncbi:MAG TPA: PKD domain-containing protein [Candidatus Limnocylindrales bacterium]|nr:PKD domain-containing protein [Candidatus Limnocylindrales bacterium]
MRPRLGPSNRDAQRGQSLVEFALLVPVLLLLVLGGLDFGRVFLGWVNLNNTARIAANYAAANAQLLNAGNAAALASYNRLVQDDATTTNCTPPDPIPGPTFAPGTGIGSHATVALSCDFQLLTPVISSVLGGDVTVSASAVFPVRSGVVAGVPAGGPPTPVAAFNISPASGEAPLTVNLNNVSTGSPTSIAWDFENDGIVDDTTANPPAHLYTVPGTYTIVLTVSNGLNSTTATRTVNVTAPPGPVADFTATPMTGTAPLSVSFTNASTGSITTWEWDFDGDGTVDSTDEDPPSRTYAEGTWTVSLTVADALGQTSTTSKVLTFSAAIPQCTVPNYKNQNSANNIQQQWTTAGFQTQVIFNPSRPPEFKITKQSLSAGSTQPCAGTVITVFDK